MRSTTLAALSRFQPAAVRSTTLLALSRFQPEVER
jgi:hypothetical protein